MRRHGVLVVDDSAIARDALRHIFESDPSLYVVGEAATGEEAVHAAAALRPDLVSLDVEMPGMGGLAAVRQIMAIAPAPILIVTSRPAAPDSALAFEALQCGALDVAEKPDMTNEVAVAALRARARRLAGVPVVRHLRSLRAASAACVEPATAQRPRRATWSNAPMVIGMGASTGGPAALGGILRALPPDFRACIAIVQHMPIGFADSFARFLQGGCRLPVEVVRGSVRSAAGSVLIAPDDRHLVAVEGGGFRPHDGDADQTHRPSATVLFHSLAEICGPSAAGVLLTGIGTDGVAGLAAMRQSGATTIAQDQRSSVVYGMPRAARDEGAAGRVLSLQQIPEALVELVSSAEVAS
jgi:two-component system chemotaxis response regulator CheB